MDRTSRSIAVVFAFGLTAIAISIPLAQAGTRPNDRAVLGAGGVAIERTTNLATPGTRPNDRAVLGAGGVARRATLVAAAPLVALSADQGFAWMEAAVGASAMLVLLCVLAGGGLLIARQRRLALR